MNNETNQSTTYLIARSKLILLLSKLTHQAYELQAKAFDIEIEWRETLEQTKMIEQQINELDRREVKENE